MARWSGLAMVFSLSACAGAPPRAPAPDTAVAVSVETPSPPTTAEPQATASEVPAEQDSIGIPPRDALATDSGLATKVLVRGTGTEHATDEDRCRVHYTGWTQDGKMFDSSVERGEPATFRPTEVIAGFREALELMVVGEKRRVWIPESLAYGSSRAVGAPAGDLIFDIELLEIIAAPKAPPDVGAPPAAAKKTASGLFYLRLVKGKGSRHPAPSDRVRVHYSGWTADGKLFDSSITRGAPSTFPLNAVIKGWTEGVMLMVEGDKTRFWIPPALAYGNSARPGVPTGTLVFEIELLKIE